MCKVGLVNQAQVKTELEGGVATNEQVLGISMGVNSFRRAQFGVV